MKESILLIGRGHGFKEYIQGMIDVFQTSYNVLVLEPVSEIKFKNKHTRISQTAPSDLPTHLLYSEVARIEKETKLNLYESYSNYFYYGRLAEEANINFSSYWKSKEELAKEYIIAYKFMADITSKYDIKFCFHDTIDLILLMMVEAFSKIKKFGFYHTLVRQGAFDERAILTCGIARKSPLLHKILVDNVRQTEEEALLIKEAINNFTKEKPIPKYLSMTSRKIISYKEFKSIPKRIKNIKYGIKRCINRAYQNRVTKNFNIQNVDDYILFFFHHQPESTTTSAATKYVDQWKIIEDIAVNAPADLNIVIKDHPYGFGWHGKEFFEKLVRLPNVYLAPVNSPGKELIQKAKIVLTINGSIGVEALMYDVPIYSLGNPWYSFPQYIENLENPTDIIAKWNNPKRLTKDERTFFLTAIYRASMPCTNYTQPEYADERLQSGRAVASHVLEHKDIYFRRIDI